MVVSQPRGRLPAESCMHNSIVITRKLNKSSTLLCSIFTTGNVAEATFQFGNSFTPGIFKGTGAPMLNEIIAFALPRAGGKRHE